MLVATKPIHRLGLLGLHPGGGEFCGLGSIPWGFCTQWPVGLLLGFLPTLAPALFFFVALGPRPNKANYFTLPVKKQIYAARIFLGSLRARESFKAEKRVQGTG